PAPRGAGVGLGLAVARGFAEAMGGTLRAEDTPGGGLSMVLTVRAARMGTGAGDGAELLLGGGAGGAEMGPEVSAGPALPVESERQVS
uniref:ATP-binding protein n=1 Tax=Streptomyces reticuliscabiei TaxID=146821 RepID=UPI00117D70DB